MQEGIDRIPIGDFSLACEVTPRTIRAICYGEECPVTWKILGPKGLHSMKPLRHLWVSVPSNPILPLIGGKMGATPLQIEWMLV